MKALFTLLVVTFLTSISLSAQPNLRKANTKIEDNIQSEIISIGWYPNPVRVGEKIKVDVELSQTSEMKTELVDALGKKVFELESTYPEGKSTINLYTNDVAPGLYFVRISTEQGFRSEKILIE